MEETKSNNDPHEDQNNDKSNEKDFVPFISIVTLGDDQAILVTSKCTNQYEEYMKSDKMISDIKSVLDAIDDPS